MPSGRSGFFFKMQEFRQLIDRWAIIDSYLQKGGHSAVSCAAALLIIF